MHIIYLNETEPGEVAKIISEMDITKSGDIYGITPKLIKIAKDEIVVNLTTLFNASFRLGKFPNMLKIAKVVPIHKGDSKMITSNYRPIPLLPILGKLLEKLMQQ